MNTAQTIESAVLAHAGAAPAILPREADAKAIGPVLLVDDSKAQRMMLTARLRRWGYDVIEAEDGAQALEIAERQRVPLILSDWVMPGLTGPEFCRALRAGEDDWRSYFILLTSRQSKADVSEGLGAGADDFLSKPVDEGELAARLKAGARVLDLQLKLMGQRQEAEAALARLKRLHDRLDQDLQAASALQKSFLPAPFSQVGAFGIAAQCLSSGHVGGDHVGFFAAGHGAIGVFSIDVAGHGVASSLLAIQLAQHFDPAHPEGNIAFEHDAEHCLRLRAPNEVVSDLNTRFLSQADHDIYFTMTYAILDPLRTEVRLCQAGHPETAIIRASGTVDFVEEGGPPVGMLPGMQYSETRIALDPGDRLLLYSDGVTEAELPNGNLLDRAGLSTLLEADASAPTNRFLPMLIDRLKALTGRECFEDDLSAILVERQA